VLGGVGHNPYSSTSDLGRILLIASLFGLLTACSNQGTVSNALKIKSMPGSDVIGLPEGRELSGAQPEDYMRILGDLRWDKMTSMGDWAQRFPGCFYRDANMMPETVLWRSGKGTKCDISVGGIIFKPAQVSFEDNSGTASKKMAIAVGFDFVDYAQERAFESAIMSKYPMASGKQGNELYCSTYTCWLLKGGMHSAIAYPTDHVISVLDNVKVDPGKF
jgi:hypothetical protein